MNSLYLSTNPYLLQHKDNPVHWQIWSEDVFQKALRSNKPVILSIGYSTCHWCHVMEHESFEDPETAELMNSHFLCIKLDREERPDLDAFYMLACQLLTGQGGWPLNCFLLPDKRPFFAGTYFPPRPAYGKPSWQQLLLHIHDIFHNKNDLATTQADKLMEVMQGINKEELSTNIVFSTNELFDFSSYTQSILKNIDPKNGGFGSAPKFPQAPCWQYLLAVGASDNVNSVIDLLTHTFGKMIQGGLWDPLRGGFARYTIDQQWRIPHFEKMLYDNAWLISDYAIAYFLTNQNWMKEIAIRTIRFWQQSMSTESGLIYSAMDADSNGQEGAYYVWSYDELKSLNDIEFNVLKENVEISKEGNWEGNHVIIFDTYQKAIDFYSHNDKNLQQAFDTLQLKALNRISPGIDYKIITSWNAWYGASLCDAAMCLNDYTFSDYSLGLMDSLVETNCKEKRIYHSSSKGVISDILLAEDYTSMAYWHLKLYQTTFDSFHIKRAQEIISEGEELFISGENGFMSNIPTGLTDNILPMIETTDSPTPSANSLLLHCYISLYQLTGHTPYIYRYEKLAAKFKSISTRNPASSMFAMSTIYNFENENTQYLITGPESRTFARQLRIKISPFALIRIIDDERQAEKLNIVLEREKTLIYTCKHFSCQLPVDNVESVLLT